MSVDQRVQPTSAGKLTSCRTLFACGVARTMSRKPTLAALVIGLCALTLLALSAPAALAAPPWGHLSSGTRPTYLHSGAGKAGANAVFKLVETGSSGSYFLEEPVAVGENGAHEAPFE